MLKITCITRITSLKSPSTSSGNFFPQCSRVLNASSCPDWYDKIVPVIQSVLYCFGCRRKRRRERGGGGGGLIHFLFQKVESLLEQEAYLRERARLAHKRSLEIAKRDLERAKRARAPEPEANGRL